MGVTYSLKLIQPARFKELYDIFNNMVEYDKEYLKTLYKKYQIEIDKYFDSEFENYSNSDKYQIEDFIKRCFDELVSEKSYYFDKTFDNIKYIIDTLPEMKCLKFLLNYEKFNIESPKKINFYTGSGIVGIWSYEVFNDVKKIFEAFTSFENIKNSYSNKAYSLIEKIFFKKKIDLAINYWSDINIIENMRVLEKVIITVLEKKIFVALEQNT